MKLFSTMTVMSMLRRQAWMKWFPPMAVASPSPLTTMTFLSGRDIFRPVAKGSARPCVVCSVFQSTYPGRREAHPIPETSAMSSFWIFSESTARRSDLKTIP